VHPTNPQFPTSNVRVLPKEGVDTSKMERVYKSNDNDTDYDSENPVDRESVQLKHRNNGTPNQSSSWVQRIADDSDDGKNDTYRAQTVISPAKKSGPPKVSATGEGKTVEEARNKAFNNASDLRMKRTQNVPAQMASADRQMASNKKRGFNKAQVIKIDSGKAQ
jgi:hypothetical protein